METKKEIITRLKNDINTRNISDISPGDALEFRRDQYGLSRQEFCDILGIQESHYSEILSGKRSVPRRVMKNAYIIGVPLHVLIG